MLTPQALMMATKMQGDEIRPLSQIVEDCIRFKHAHEAERTQNETK